MALRSWYHGPSSPEDGPPDVKVIEVGISGIMLVQELLDGYDGLIIFDTART